MKNRQTTLKNKHTKKYSRKNGKKCLKKRSTFRKKNVGGFFGLFKKREPVILGPEPTGKPEMKTRAEIYAETRCLEKKFKNDYNECLEEKKQFFNEEKKQLLNDIYIYKPTGSQSIEPLSQ
jgi:hypothetical protein